MGKKYWYQLILLLLTVLFTGIGMTHAADTATTISPFRFDITGDKGQVKIDYLKVYNRTEKPVTYQLSVEDFYAKDELGNPGFIPMTEENSSFSLAQWVKFDTPTVVVPANGETQIPFRISIPAYAEPGGHYASLFLTPVTEDAPSTVAVQARIGSLLLLTVRGEVKKELHLESFGVYDKEVTWEEGIAPQKQTILGELPVHFALRFKNGGTVHGMPTGKIELYDMFGKKMSHIGLEKTVSEEGVLIEQKRVDYLAVNSERGAVLPNSYRVFRGIPWEGVLYEVFNPDTGTKEIVKEKAPFYFGKYRAVLTLTIGDQTVTQTTEFWILPWKAIGFWILMISLTIILLIVVVKKAKQHLKAQVLKDLHNSDK